MACCLTAPRDYLNQCWQIISEVLWHSSQGNFTCDAKDIYPWNEFKNEKNKTILLQSHYQGANELMYVEHFAWWHSYTSLTHWGRATHICVGKLTIIGSDNGLSPGRRQAIIWTIAGILLIGPFGTNFSEILIGFQIFSLKEMHLKMSSAKWRPFCLGLDVLIQAADNRPRHLT